MLMTVVSCDSGDKATKTWTGKWNWVSTCGGITGACGYPDQHNFKTMQITKSKIVTVTNGSTTMETDYVILSKTEDGDELLLEIKNDNGEIFSVRTNIHSLSIEKGDFWESYERIYPR
jgi:hypothetical protein